LTHWLPLHTLPGGQSESPQHAKHPEPAQQVVPLVHDALNEQIPALHVSVVQGFPSLHWEPLQHCWQEVPQSFGVPGSQSQVPLVQTAPGLQEPLQPPQFFGSVCVFTSQSAGLASQFANPVTHCGVPATQIWLRPMGLLHPPQFCGSVCRSTQEAPHRERAPHPTLQVVPSHAGVAVLHEVVHDPQWLGSVAGVSHPSAPLQSRYPPAQPHWPAATQVACGPQSRAQEPQVPAATREASQPSTGLLLQSSKLGAQVQPPATQTSFAPQTLPQPPQLVGSDRVSVSHPLVLSPSQSAVPLGHTQAPPAHSCWKAHAMPQLPQF
jgi:hypothetical protein